MPLYFGVVVHMTWHTFDERPLHRLAVRRSGQKSTAALAFRHTMFCQVRTSSVFRSWVEAIIEWMMNCGELRVLRETESESRIWHAAVHIAQLSHRTAVLWIIMAAHVYAWKVTIFCGAFFLFLSNVVLRDHRTELNRILPHVLKWLRFENARPKFGFSPIKRVIAFAKLF